MVAIVAQAGCWGSVKENVVRLPHPDPAKTPSVATEKEPLEPEIVATRVDGSLRVTVQQRTNCRERTVTPMRDDVHVSRTLESGLLVQGTNAVAAVLLGGLGLALTTAEGSPDCVGGKNSSCATESQAKGIRTAGYVTAAAAAIPIGVLVANALRAMDRDTPNVEASPKETVSEWKTCERKPLSGLSVGLQDPAGPKDERVTNDAGEVVFEAGMKGLSSRIEESWIIDLTIPGAGRQLPRVSDAIRAPKKAACLSEGDVSACLTLADELDRELGLPFLKRACELKNEKACKLEEEARAAVESQRRRSADAQRAQDHPREGCMQVCDQVAGICLDVCRENSCRRSCYSERQKCLIGCQGLRP